MRIWVPANLAVVVDDPTLNLIIPTASLSGIDSTCNTPVYQRTAVHATCDFVDGGPTIPGVDVTSLVTFVSTSSSIAVVNNYIQVNSTPFVTHAVSSATALQLEQKDQSMCTEASAPGPSGYQQVEAE